VESIIALILVEQKTTEG